MPDGMLLRISREVVILQNTFFTDIDTSFTVSYRAVISISQPRSKHVYRHQTVTSEYSSYVPTVSSIKRLQELCLDLPLCTWSLQFFILIHPWQPRTTSPCHRCLCDLTPSRNEVSYSWRHSQLLSCFLKHFRLICYTRLLPWLLLDCLRRSWPWNFPLIH